MQSDWNSSRISAEEKLLPLASIAEGQTHKCLRNNPEVGAL